MPIFRFRAYWEEDDLVYRDIEIQNTQSFLVLHEAILKAYDFTENKFAGTFTQTNDKWQPDGHVLSSEVMVNKKDAPALSMMKTPVAALVAKPDQKFYYEYDPTKRWTFLVELIGIDKEENPKRTYPYTVRKEGLAPSQAGVKGVGGNAKLMEAEEAYDLSAEDMAEGFGNEGEDGTTSFSGGAETGGGFDE